MAATVLSSSAVVIRLPYRCMACKFRLGSRYKMSPDLIGALPERVKYPLPIAQPSRYVRLSTMLGSNHA